MLLNETVTPSRAFTALSLKLLPCKEACVVRILWSMSLFYSSLVLNVFWN